jgi:hypothetical protein
VVRAFVAARVLQDVHVVGERTAGDHILGEQPLDTVLEVQRSDRFTVRPFQAWLERVGPLRVVGVVHTHGGCRVRAQLEGVSVEFGVSRQSPGEQALQIPAEAVVHALRIPRVTVVREPELKRAALLPRRVDDLVISSVVRRGRRAPTRPTSGTRRSGRAAGAAPAGRQRRRSKYCDPRDRRPHVASHEDHQRPSWCSISRHLSPPRGASELVCRTEVGASLGGGG